MPDSEDGAHRFEPPLSTMAASVVRNPIRKVMLKMKATPGCISLAGGRPPACVFPARARELGEDLMNYGPQLAVGTDGLREWAREFVDKFHAPPGGWKGRDVLLTSGNTDGMTKAVMLLSDPGDYVIADEVTYPGITASALPLGRRVLGVRMDADGMVPDALAAAVEGICGGGGSTAGTDVSAGRPRLLYLTPHGQNPTGATLPNARKEALYAVARRFGLTILEDDPYYFLNLTPRVPGAPLEPSDMRGTGDAPKSFLSMDTDGRVVRLDSVSKVFAPGYRIGWVTAGKAVIDKWAVLGEVLTWSLSGVQQSAFLALLQDLGTDGFDEHLKRLQSDYARRCRFLVKACDRHLQGLCTWRVPDFGMFLWLEALGVEDTAAVAEDIIGSHGVAAVPGVAFKASQDPGQRSGFFRLSFSQLTEETADEAAARLRAALEGLRARRAAAPRPEGPEGPAPKRAR